MAAEKLRKEETPHESLLEAAWKPFMRALFEQECRKSDGTIDREKEAAFAAQLCPDKLFVV
jgi:hypothetical protein